MSLRPPRSTLTAPLFPYTPLFRSDIIGAADLVPGIIAAQQPVKGAHISGQPQLLIEALHSAIGIDPCALQRRTVAINAVIFVIARRSEEHTSELQSLMRIPYAVFCSKKNTHIAYQQIQHIQH